MYESPRTRRLRSDLAALERLRDESSVLRFRASGTPPQHYVVELHGKGLARPRGRVVLVDRHEVEIKLGASYPRTMPEIRWLSPVYHPNISEVGSVCLGGYGTHWVPSLNLDELCGMLWDMARYHNYDVRSPYNREAALWVANQSGVKFPTDPRPLRDVRAALGRVEPRPAPAPPRTHSHPDLDLIDDPADTPKPGVGRRAARFRQFVQGQNRAQGGGAYEAFVETVPADIGDRMPGEADLDETGDSVILDRVPSPPADPGGRDHAPGDEIVFLD